MPVQPLVSTPPPIEDLFAEYFKQQDTLPTDTNDVRLCIEEHTSCRQYTIDGYSDSLAAALW